MRRISARDTQQLAIAGIWATGIVTALILLSIFVWDIFPACFVEGAGLTPFKKISEYVISFILLLAIGVLFRNRLKFDARVFWLVVASLVVTIASELSFTLYSDPYGFFNLMGHYLKIMSFYLIYRAIVETGLERPYDLLFRDLKLREEELAEREERESAILNATGSFLCLVRPVHACSTESHASCLERLQKELEGSSIYLIGRMPFFEEYLKNQLTADPKEADIFLVCGDGLFSAEKDPLIDRYMAEKRMIFLGPTTSGIAAMLNLEHWCPYGT